MNVGQSTGVPEGRCGWSIVASSPCGKKMDPILEAASRVSGIYMREDGNLNK